MKKMKAYFTMSFAILLLLQISCSSETDDDLSENISVKTVSHSSLGDVLTDKNGQILYFFTKDLDGNSACIDGCLSKWPVFYAEEILLPESSTLNAADFSSITRADNSKQTTYRGWPLYYYSPTADGILEAAGEATGEGIGTVWYVAKPDYDVMIADWQLVGNDGKNYTSTYEEGDGLTKFFTDGDGNTLYAWVNDSTNTNKFTKADLSNNGSWPIFHKALRSVPSAINISDFTEIDVHGQKQLTYKGWPLYYFGADENRGDTKGISVPAPGVWPIVNTTTNSL